MIDLDELKAAALATKANHDGELSRGGLVLACRWHHEQKGRADTLQELRSYAGVCIGANCSPMCDLCGSALRFSSGRWRCFNRHCEAENHLWY